MPKTTSNLLLDVYTNAAVAYSLRKLRTAYTGNCIRVRRSSDNAEQDIGFTSSGDLDTAALKTFTGSNSGFVTTWYNQGDSSGRDVSQSAAANQPRIVNAGVVDRQNGKVAMIYDGSNDFLEAATSSNWRFLHQAGNYTNIGVARAGNVTDPEAFYIIWGTTNTVTRRGAYLGHDTRSSASRDRVLIHVIGNALTPGTVVLNNQSAGTTPANTQFLNFLFATPDSSSISSRSFLATNNGASATNNVNNATPQTGDPNHPLAFGMARNASSTAQFFLLGSIQEQIFYNSNQLSNRTVISNNINSYYYPVIRY